MSVLAEGRKAPAFELSNQDGETVSLKSFSSRWVILYFYPKDNTSGCTKEAVAFSEMLSDFREKKATIIGISPDSPKSHQRFTEKHGLRIELLSDQDHAVCEAFGVWQLKKMYGREYMGVVRSTFLINPQGIIEKTWSKVKVAGHAQDVYQALCAL